MPVVDLSFSIQGDLIPLDHGYQLFSALSRIVPCIHQRPNVGVHPIKGSRIGPGVLSLQTHSRLKLRVESESIGDFLPIAGSEIDLNGHLLSIGVPSMEQLTPSANLGARLVTIKGMKEPDSFLETVRRLLIELHIQAHPELVPSNPSEPTSPPIRRVVRIQGRSVVGFAMRLKGLTAEQSISVQEQGLGGRRHMGCGIFLPY